MLGQTLPELTAGPLFERYGLLQGPPNRAPSGAGPGGTPSGAGGALSAAGPSGGGPGGTPSSGGPSGGTPSGAGGVYRPEGPLLGDLVELRLTFDSDGRCDSITVVLPRKLTTHPLLGDPVAGLLADILREASEDHKSAARFTEQRPGWPSDPTPLEVELGPCLLTRTPHEDRLSYRFTRLARRGLLARLGWHR